MCYNKKLFLREVFMGDYNEIVLRSISLADLDYLYRFYNTKYNSSKDERVKAEASRRSDICRDMFLQKLGEYERHIFIVPIDEYPKKDKKK